MQWNQKHATTTKVGIWCHKRLCVSTHMRQYKPFIDMFVHVLYIVYFLNHTYPCFIDWESNSVDPNETQSYSKYMYMYHSGPICLPISLRLW